EGRRSETRRKSEKGRAGGLGPGADAAERRSARRRCQNAGEVGAFNQVRNRLGAAEKGRYSGPFHFLTVQYHWPPVSLGDPMKSSKIALTLIAVAVGLIGCGEDKKPEVKKAEAPPPPPSIEIKIGHVGPLTGGIAHLGKDNENGARLAIAEANAAKIKIDGKDAKFVLVAEDDQADPKVGTTVAQKLVDAKVAGVVGHLNSGTTIPASAIYNQAGIPVITGSATNPKLTEQGFKVVFPSVGGDSTHERALDRH